MPRNSPELLRTLGNGPGERLPFHALVYDGNAELGCNTVRIGIDIATNGPHRLHGTLEVRHGFLASHVLDAAGMFRERRHKGLDLFSRPVDTLSAPLRID